MAKRTTSFALYSILCVELLLLIGCDNSNNEKSWHFFDKMIEKELSGKKKLDTNLIENVFVENVEIMRKMVDLCEKHPVIRRVGSMQEEVSYYGNNFNENQHSEQQIVAKMRDYLDQIGSSSVSCMRRGDFVENPLAVVSFVMYRSGLSVSGELVSIVYRTNWSHENNKVSEKELQSRGYKSLGKPRWYMFKSN